MADNYEGYDPKTGGYIGANGRQQIIGAIRENKKWLAACWASQCSRYPPYVPLHTGELLEERCGHDWCKGVVDVLNRVLGPRR